MPANSRPFVSSPTSQPHADTLSRARAPPPLCPQAPDAPDPSFPGLPSRPPLPRLPDLDWPPSGAGPGRGHLQTGPSASRPGPRLSVLTAQPPTLAPHSTPWTSSPQHTSASATAGPLSCPLVLCLPALSRPLVPCPQCLPSRTPESRHPCCSEVTRLSPCNTLNPWHPAPLAPCPAPAPHPPAPCVTLVGWAGGRVPPTQTETGPREQAGGQEEPGGAGGRTECGSRVTGPGGGLGAFTSPRKGGPGGHQGKAARPASGCPQPADPSTVAPS